MKKLVLPSVLAATVIIAGIFAFLPVDKASTVHDQITAELSGANEVRVVLEIPDNEYDCGDSCFEYGGEIRIQKHTPGFFQVEKLYLCDAEADSYTWFWYSGAVNNEVHEEDTEDFDVNVGEVSLPTSLVPDLANLRGSGLISGNQLFGSHLFFDYGSEEGCVDLLTVENFLGFQGQPFVRLAGDGSTNPPEDVAIFLHEDFARIGSESSDEDGAYLLAYIKGQNLSSSTNGEDIWIMHTPLEEILLTSDYTRSDVDDVFGDLIESLKEMTTSLGL